MARRSGLGMVRNCCGGATLGSDVWTRTLATVGNTANASDQHGTTAANEWDFSSWKVCQAATDMSSAQPAVLSAWHDWLSIYTRRPTPS